MLDQALAFVLDVHPGRFRYTTQAELDVVVQHERAWLASQNDVTPRHQAAALARVMATLGDAHLRIGVDEPPTNLLPLWIKRVAGSILVDASEPALPLGTELVSIDNVPVEGLVPELAALVAVDARRSEVALAQVERRFALLLWIHVGPRVAYEVLVRLPDGTERMVRLPGVSMEQMDLLKSRRQSGPIWGQAPEDGSPWPFIVEGPDHVPLLRLASFGTAETDAYQNRIDALFVQVAQAGRLVIDVRGNPGGVRQNGIAVLQHLITEPFVQWARVATRVKAIPKVHRLHTRFVFAPRQALTGFPGKLKDGFWVFDGDPLAEEMQPKTPTFEGEVVVFVDEGTNSAAMEMVMALVAHRPDVRIIGTETLGECGRHTGQMPVVFAPDGAGVSLLAFVFEVTLVETPTCKVGSGAPLTTKVNYTREHFKQGVDPFVLLLDEPGG